MCHPVDTALEATDLDLTAEQPEYRDAADEMPDEGICTTVATSLLLWQFHVRSAIMYKHLLIIPSFHKPFGYCRCTVGLLIK